MASASPERPNPPGKSLLETYLGYFPLRGTSITKVALAAHFQSVARNLMAKASECFAASDMLQRSVDPLPTPLRRFKVKEVFLKTRQIFSCEVNVNEVLGVPSPNSQTCRGSAYIEVHRDGDRGFQLNLYDLSTRRNTIIHIAPESKAEAKVLTNILAMMSKTLKADGARAEYRLNVPSDRLCKFCGRLPVRPSHVVPGSPEDAHRDLNYCMTCKAYLDASK